MRKLLVLVLVAAMMMMLVPTVAFAAEGATLPAAVSGVITLEAGVIYGEPGGVEGIPINQGVTIIGNGATIKKLRILTNEPVIIENVNFESFIYINGVETGGRYDFDVTIEDCTFGTASDDPLPFRRLYMPEDTKPQDGSLTVKNCTFYPTTSYVINLLRVANIHFEGNTFYSGSGTALQYTVTGENKDNINIFNNVFNGTGQGLLVTIANGSFDASGHIGNVYNNTFSGTRVTVSVSDPDVETLTVQQNTGLSAGNLWFSSYSANTRFKPSTTGPLTSAMLQNVIFASGTIVLAQADPVFTVVIPASVNFGKIHRGMAPQTRDFDIKVQNALIDTGAVIEVKNITTPLLMKDNSGVGPAELAFTLAEGTVTFLQADLTDGAETITNQVSCIPANLTASGTYQGAMTFEIVCK